MKVVYEMCRCPAYSLITLLRMHVCLSQLYYLFIWYLSFLESSDDFIGGKSEPSWLLFNQICIQWLAPESKGSKHLRQTMCGKTNLYALQRSEGAVSCQEGSHWALWVVCGHHPGACERLDISVRSSFMSTPVRTVKSGTGGAVKTGSYWTMAGVWARESESWIKE